LLADCFCDGLFVFYVVNPMVLCFIID
jgi:hypothetical protein